MNGINNAMLDYYAQRASEYERIYIKPERQADLRKLEEFLNNALRDEHVLEIACGTGYWTRVIAKSAASILATDYNSEVIELAKLKDYAFAVLNLLGRMRTRWTIYQAGTQQAFMDSGGHTFPVQKSDYFLRLSTTDRTR